MSHTSPPHKGSARAAGMKRLIRKSRTKMREAARKQANLIAGVVLVTEETENVPSVPVVLRAGVDAPLKRGDEFVPYSDLRFEFMLFDLEIADAREIERSTKNALKSLLKCTDKELSEVLAA